MKLQSHRLSRQMVAFLHDLTMAAVSFVAARVLRHLVPEYHEEQIESAAAS